MAVVQNFNQDDQDNQQQQTQAGQPITLSGSATGPSTGAGQGQGSTQANSYNAQAPTSSGRFTNLQSYLNANKDYNAQNGGLAGQIQSNLSGQAKNIQDAAGTAAQQFQSGADANRIQYNQDIVNNATSNPYAFLNPAQNTATSQSVLPASSPAYNTMPLSSNQSTPQQLNGTSPTYNTMPISSPGSFNNLQNMLTNGNTTQNTASAASPAALTSSTAPTSSSNLAAFQNQLNATYNPVDTNLQPSINQASQFQSTANLAGTEPGRYALLKNLYGGSGYNTGQQKLDNLLLQGNPDQLNVLNTVPTLGANLNTSVNNQLNQENALNTQYGQEAIDTQNKTKAALAGAVDPLVQQTLASQKSAQDAYAASQANAQNELKNQSISAADAAKFGLSSSTPLFGMSPQQLSSYLTMGSDVATPQNAMTQDQYNNFQALSKLAGNTLGGTDPNDPLAKAGAELQPYLGASQVGQFAQQNPFTFNAGQFNNDIAANRNAYINAATQANNQIKNSLGQNLPDLKSGVSTSELLSNLNSLQNFQAQHPEDSSSTAPNIQALQNIIKSYGINPANIASGTQDPYSGIGSLNVGSPDLNTSFQTPTQAIEGGKGSPKTVLQKPVAKPKNGGLVYRQ